MLLGELDLDGKKVTSTLSKMEGGLGGFMGKLGAVGGPMLAFGAVMAGVAVIANGFHNTLDFSGRLADISARTGESASDLTILGEAFNQAGLGADGMESFFLKLENSMGGVNEQGEKTTAAFDALGISVDQLKGLDAIGKVELLQKGFAGLADQASKVQAASNLFGKGLGGKALGIVGDSGSLDGAKQSAGSTASLMGENVQAFDKLGDSLGELKLNFHEFFGGALSIAAPALTDLAEKFGNVDFRGLGEAFGSVITAGASLAGVLGDVVLPAVNEVSSLLHGVFGGAGGSMAKVVAEGGKKDGGPSALGGPAKAEFGAVSSLQRVGLGGGFGGGGDAISEQRKTNGLLQQLVALGKPSGEKSKDRAPVPV